MGSDARSEMLERIRKATKRSGVGADMTQAAGEWSGITRAYRRGATHDRGEILRMLVERLKDYDADVAEVSRDGVAGAVAKFLEKRGKPKMLMAEGFRVDFLPPVSEGFSFDVEHLMTSMEINNYTGVITEATLAIAETGSFVLQTVPGQGRRVTTLVPDYHLCVIDAATVVESVPEAMAKLQATAHLPTTFVSGPSATADIEMTRVKGVHGPRFLDVVVYS